MMKNFLLTNVYSNFSISNLTCVMNHLKFIFRASVVVLALLVGFTSRVSAQSCPVSQAITITVVPDLDISADPQSLTQCEGGNEPISVTVTGGTGVSSYRWEKSPTGAANSWVTVDSSANSSYTPVSTGPYPDSAYYRVVVFSTGTGCGEKTSLSALVKFTPQLTITDHPDNIVQCQNGADVLTFAYTGGAGNVTYRWKQSTTENGIYTDVAPAATGPTFTPPSGVIGSVMYYKVEIDADGDNCSEVLSNPARVEIKAPIDVTVSPNSINCYGNGWLWYCNVSVAAKYNQCNYWLYERACGWVRFILLT
jgi:hypothetical protein